jgi:DNA repair exonuclease SbcCD ATPase subunit
VRITAAQRIQNENRIRAAMDRLLRGEIPADGNCDIKTLAREAGVDRAAFYGNRPYAHLRIEFEQRLQQLQRDGHTPDPKTAQIERLKADLDTLRTRLAQANTTIDQLTDFRTQALSRLAAQHEEILRLRAAAEANTNVARLPVPRQKVIGPC